MANKFWLGTETSYTGDLDRSANWYPVGVPTAGDDLIFDGRSTQGVTDNLDVFVGVDLGSLTVWNGYTGNIGSSGSTPLQMECTTGEVYFAGTGRLYLQCAGSAQGDDAVIPKCIINSSGSAWLSSWANDNTHAAPFTIIQVIKGKVFIQGDSEKSGTSGHGGDSGCAVGTLKVTPTGAATVRVGDECVNFKGTDAPMSVIIDGGTLTAHSTLEDIQQMGGAFNYGSTEIDMDGDDDDITSLTISGGTFYWKPQNSGSISPTPTIGALDVIAGTLNGVSMKQTNPGGADPVVTLCWQYGGTVDLRNVYTNFDFTTYYKEGGSLHTDPGQELSLEGGA